MEVVVEVALCAVLEDEVALAFEFEIALETNDILMFDFAEDLDLVLD